MTSVEIMLTLGHRATQKALPSEGFTHDWSVFVKSDEGNAIENFVEKVVFNLHSSFTKPKRVLKSAPYEVSEQGYAGFMMQIDIHFRNKVEPKKVTYQYDMFLRLDDSVVNHQKEKLTFHNPNEEFKKKLIKGGGIVLNENKAIGSGSSETALSKSRSTSSQANSQPAAGNHHSNHSTGISASNSGPSAPTTTTANSLSTIRTKNVIPSKDKSQQQHLSAASSNQHHSPNHSQPPKSRDEHSKSTKEKHHQSKNAEFATLFGTPIQAKSSKEGKTKKSKSSSEKSGNSRCSTPTSTISSNHQLAAREYPDVKKERSHSKDSAKQLNKSNSSSGSNGQSRGLAKADKPNKIKKQLDLPANTSNSSNKSHKSPSVASKHDEKKRHHHSKGLKGSRSPSNSSVDSASQRRRLADFNKSIKFKKRKRSNSTSSNDSVRSEHSSRASVRSYSSSSARSSASSIRSDSNSSRGSSVSSSEHRPRSKKRNRDQYSPVKKKSKKAPNVSHPKAKVKKEQQQQPSNISSSRNLSSSLSSINSESKATKEESKKKPKDRPREDDDDEVPGKKGHKEKRKRKEADETNGKKSKTAEPGGKAEERSSNKKQKSGQSKSDKELQPQKIIKEKNKDSINKQTSHKEHNLKKEATTSTKISFSNNNSTGLTTLEITSVKNVKMLQSESKKSKQHQDQSLNQSDKRSFKDKLPADSYAASPLAKDDHGTPCSSPGYPDYQPSSKQQADESRRKSDKLAYERIMSDMRKNSEEISPLTSDSDSKMNFDDPYHSNESSALRSNFPNGSVKEEAKGRKSKRPTHSFADEADEEPADDPVQHEYVSDLVVLQKQISELKDKELLHEIVRIVRESGTFTMNGTKFDFDLLKLDKTTVKKVKMCFS